MSTSTLDILLPFYGDAELMKQAVDSIRSQTDEAWRLVVVDDGQPDTKVADWFTGLGDARIEYHRNHRNIGANENYRKALGMATADLVVMMGADDLMRPGYVERAKSAFRRSPEQVVMYLPGVRLIDEHGLPTRSLGDGVKTALRPRAEQMRRLDGEALAVSLLRGNWTYFPAMCWRREEMVHVGFRPDLHVVQDLALILDLVQRGYSMVLDSESTFEYRRHRASDSSVKSLSAVRFDEERDYFAAAAGEFDAMGWLRAAGAARTHLTSRLNALSMIPAALRRSPRTAPRLLRHAVGRA